MNIKLIGEETLQYKVFAINTETGKSGMNISKLFPCTLPQAQKIADELNDYAAKFDTKEVWLAVAM